MISEYELGSILAGRKRAEGGVHHIESAIILGEAVEDSSNGKVRVVPYGDVFNPDGDNTVIMATSPSVKAGDTVQISLVGGVSKRPMVVAVGGSGDRLRSTADAASQAASQAQQDIADFKSGADVDYAIYEYVDEETGELSRTVAATYVPNSSYQSDQSALSVLLGNMQDQIDGQVEAWYYSVDPTTSNPPASSWNTESLKKQHEGDLYYNDTNGHAWRWVKENNVWGWKQIPDSDAAAALALAQQKRRIFTAQPTVPYEVGDLWVRTVDGARQIWSCKTARATGSYSVSDWQLASTDDTALDSYRQTVAQTYATQSQLTQTAESIEASVSQDYVSKADAQTTYATKSELTVGLEGIELEVSQNYATKEEAYELSQPNLSPFFSMPIGDIHSTDNPNGYWNYLSGNAFASALSDGWMHIAYTTSGSAATLRFHPYAADWVKPDTRYTLLVEFRNMTASGDTRIYAGAPSSSLYKPQMFTQSHNMAFTSNTKELRFKYDSKSDFTGCLALIATSYYLDANCSVDGDIRVSLYEGDYDGPYKPYGGSDFYTTKSELTVGLDGITSEVSQTYATKTEAATTGSGSGESVEVASGAGLRSLTLYGKSVQDGTPTPSSPVPIETVGPPNKLDAAQFTASSTATLTQLGDGFEVVSNSTGTYRYARQTISGLTEGRTYTLSAYIDVISGTGALCIRNSSNVIKVNSGAQTASGWAHVTFTYSASVHSYFSFFCTMSTSADGDVKYTKIMLNEGSTAMPYVPYGSLGLKVSDSSDAVLSVTPIPLNGNVLASLPDGTKDVLTVDASGHCVIEKNTHAEVFDGSETWKAYASWDGNGQYCYYTNVSGIPASVVPISSHLTGITRQVFGGSTKPVDTCTVDSGRNMCVRVPNTSKSDFQTWLGSNNMTAYFPAANSSTIDLGYITMPELADGCTVGIIASLTPTIDAGWYTGNGSEIYAQSTRITQTEQDVTTAITGVEGLQTMVRQYGNGVLVCRTGNSVGALVNADGSFDVVSVTWSGDVPTAGDSVATFNANSVTLGVAPDASISGGDSSAVRMNGGLFEIVSGIVTALDYCITQIKADSTSHVYNEMSMVIDGEGFSVGKNRGALHANVNIDGNVHIKGPTAGLGETPGISIAITKTYSSSGFDIENTAFHATADMVVLPIQFTATSNVALSAQKVATIPAAYAPAESARCAIWCSPSWSGSDFTCGYVDVNPSGEISVTAPSAKYWFGQVVWIRS